jgi:hypothetical protein
LNTIQVVWMLDQQRQVASTAYTRAIMMLLRFCVVFDFAVSNVFLNAEVF